MSRAQTCHMYSMPGDVRPPQLSPFHCSGKLKDKIFTKQRRSSIQRMKMCHVYEGCDSRNGHLNYKSHLNMFLSGTENIVKK